MKIEKLIMSPEVINPLESDIFEHSKRYRFSGETEHSFLVDEKHVKTLEYISSLGDCYIAGGAFKDILRNKDPRDYDVYFDNSSKYSDMKLLFLSSFSLLYENENCIAFNIPNAQIPGSVQYGYTKVELVKIKGNENFLEKIDTFDIRSCKVYYRNGDLFGVDDALDYLVEEVVKVDSYKNPIGTLYRVVKYGIYGYTIPNKVMFKFIIPIIGFMIKNRNEKSLFSLIKKQFKINYDF